mmetsp:Transcript_24833/g.27725  ORF Transcript_24833/g.27725 Transcript_24833/m.27725 type:complete len:130 (-) Transcript_24833:239-628(-)
MKSYPRYISFHLRYNNNKDHFLSTTATIHRRDFVSLFSQLETPSGRDHHHHVHYPCESRRPLVPIVVCEFPGGSEHQSAWGPPAVSSNDERSNERLEQYCQSKNDGVTTPGVELSDEVGVGEDEDEDEG